MAFNKDKCLKFTALQASISISIYASGVDSSHYYFSKDEGATWVPDSITLEVGESAYCKGTNFPARAKFSVSDYTKDIALNGNIMSLVDDGAGEEIEITSAYAFYQLFKLLPISSIPSDLLPATSLASDCYEEMFDSNTHLTSVPEGLLPATEIQPFCYKSMFGNCTNLSTLPKHFLPATELQPSCYSFMFYNCPSLTVLPKDLLPAQTLIDKCYEYMFSRCRGLREITVKFTNWNVSSATQNWVGQVASEGIFYCPKELPLLTGTSKIPVNWQVNPKNIRPVSMTFLNKKKIGGRVKDGI